MQVYCGIPSGLNCGAFTLKAGFSDVPDDLWDAWALENQDYAPFVMGRIRANPAPVEAAPVAAPAPVSDSAPITPVERAPEENA